MVLWCALFFPLSPAAAQGQPKSHILILHSYNRGYIWTDKIAAGMEEVTLVFLENLRIEEIAEQAARLPQDSFMFFLIFFRDKTGRVFSFDESFRFIQARTRVPIYSLWDMYLGLGIVGGMLTDGYAQGEVAAQIAVRILRGEKPSAIKVVRQSPNRYLFDYQQLQKFGLDPDQLPAGSSIINRPYSLTMTEKRTMSAAFSSISPRAKDWKINWPRPRRWRPWDFWPGAWPTISTTCSRPSRATARS